MANHRAAAICLTVSLLAAIAHYGAEARPAVFPDETSAALSDANEAHQLGLADTTAEAMADPECDDDGKPRHGKHHKGHKKKPKPDDNQGRDGNTTKPQPYNPMESPYPAPNSVDQVLCDGCEEPMTPPPPCNTCEQPKEPEMTCNKVHAVRDGETCYSMGQCAGLGLDDFLRFNPNVCCDNLFIGQWVCLDATCAA